MKEGPTIPELYYRTDAADPTSNFDSSLFTPQVLITCAALHATCSIRSLLPPTTFTLLLPGMCMTWASFCGRHLCRALHEPSSYRALQC